jgi:uncharacterized membrane protein YqaE (UPF0057 family)
MATSREDLLLIIIAILLPPLAVFLEEGLELQFVINLVLTVIGFWILGVVHAVWIVLR